MGVWFAHADSDKVEGKSDWGEICGNFLPLKVFKPKYLELTSYNLLCFLSSFPFPPATDNVPSTPTPVTHSFISACEKSIRQEMDDDDD